MTSKKFAILTCFLNIFILSIEPLIQQQQYKPILKENLKMLNPYQNYLESLMFYHLHFQQPLFNYQPIHNQTKFSSNFVLVENTQTHHQNILQDQKALQTISHSEPICKPKISEKQKKLQKQSKRPFKEYEQIQKKVKKVKKMPRRNEIIQKEGRNSHSNILRKFFKLLFVQKQILPTVEKIIRKYELKIQPETFFMEMKKKGVDHRNYIRIKEVDWLMQTSQNPINKIVRILFSHYLKNYYIEHLLSSRKTNVKSVMFHLEGKRNICDEIKQEILV